jgi:hypothetical protein
VVPLALLYYAAKLLLHGILHGIPAAIDLLATAARSLCRDLGRLCKLLGLALAALAGGVARCCVAFRRCWREAIEAVVVPCKRCLFALHDAVVLPLCACARMLVVAPLSACRMPKESGMPLGGATARQPGPLGWTGPAGCWAALRAREEHPSHSGRHGGLRCHRQPLSVA